MEEFVAGLFFGGLFAFPTGWFLKTAFVWRREARKATTQVEPPRSVSQPTPQASAAVENRLERLVDLVNRRLEAMEDRMEFAERLLDSRSIARLDGAGDARRLSQPPAESETMKR